MARLYKSPFTNHISHFTKKTIFASSKIVSPKSITMNIILFLLIGAVAGWLAGKLMKGGGFGLVVNIIVGVIGGFLGGWLMSLVGIEKGGLVWEIITSVIGACLLIFVLSLIKRK
jgi:uncharacterized membrane protein YeaQ/YmgE (transglycosylase-associated protein family)